MKVTKLLAVVTLATSTPVVADPAKAPAKVHVTTKPKKVVAHPKPVAARPAPTPVVRAMVPRQLPTGAPACGNVMSKVQRPCVAEPAPSSKESH